MTKESAAPFLSEALALLDGALQGVRLASETVPLHAALGRRLAAPARSRLDLPPFDKAAMDGYALPAGDARDEYRVRETVAAGQAGPQPLQAGEAVRVMTGAPVPPGTEMVVRQEDTRQEEDRVRILRRGPRNVCPRGEDVRAGDEVLSAGSLLRPLDLANLAGCGLGQVEVVRRPRLAIISTGNEVVDDPTELRPGRIMNVNGPLLAGLAQQDGCEVALQVTVRDQADPLRQALADELAAAEIVVLSGGVSVGEFDLVPDALEALGLRVLFAGLRLKPGRPTLAAAAPGGKLVSGLPGNPLSVHLMYHLFVRHALARLTGAPPPFRTLSLPLAAAFRRGLQDREEFVPARLTPEGRIEPLECHGSAHLLSLTRADGYLIVPAGARELQSGAAACFMPLPGGLA